MPLDIDGLSEPELLDLHHRITERLRLIHQLRAHGAMMKFSLGDRVSFQAEHRIERGTLTRYNRRTVTILDDDGRYWNVSPGFLTRLESAPGPEVRVTHIRAELEPESR